MANRYIKCILGPDAGRHFWLDSCMDYLPVPQWPQVDVRTAIEMVQKHHAGMEKVELKIVNYRVQRIRWGDEYVDVLVPEEFAKNERLFMRTLLEIFFR